MDPARAHESKAFVPVAVAVGTVGASTIVVALRCYTRLFIIKQWGYDDVGAVVSLLMAIGCGVTIASLSLYGSGRHIETVDPSLLPLYFRAFYVSIVMYNAALTSVKFTFLLQYHRIFEVRKMQRAIFVSGIFIGCWTLSQLLIVIFNCHPISKFWKPELPGVCIPNLPFWYVNAAGNILTDVTIFVLPLPVLRTLNLHRHQKLVLLGIFSLGFFTCAISLIRIQYLRLSDDTTWDNVGAACWSVTEPCSAILCVCLPVLRPLGSRILGGRFWSSHGSNSKTYHQHSAGRDGSAPHHHHHSSRHHRTRGGGGGNSLAGPPSETSSQRVFVGGGGGGSKSEVLHTQDLELQRVDSDGGCSSSSSTDDGSPEVSRPGLALIMQGGRPQTTGLRPGITTEIRAMPPRRSSDMSTPPARGITVHRNVVIDES